VAVNKNFVIKNGLEVNNRLILADANTNKVGIGSTGPRFELDVAGGIGATDLYVIGVSTALEYFNVGSGGKVLSVIAGADGIGTSKVGIGTSNPEYLLEVRSPVSTGQTALYVHGDLQVTGDLKIDDIVLDQANISRLYVSQNLDVTGAGSLLVQSGVSTFGGYVDINLNADISGTVNIGGATTIGGYLDINNSIDATGTVNIGGATTIGGYLDINNSIDATGTVNIGGATTIGGYLDVNNSIDATGTVNIGGATTIGGYLDVNAASDISGSLNVGGATTIGGYLDVNAASDISGSLNVGGATTIGGYLDVNAASDISGSLNVGGIATLGSVLITSGIVTATSPSGIVTYYGDGSELLGVIGGIGIGTTGGLVGYGITFLNLFGAGVSTTQYESSVGIATIFFEGGGGGGSISISTVAPTSPGSGDLWYSPDYGRTFIYYDENIVGYGTDAYWVDAAPFNVGVITSLTNVSLTNVSFSAGSATAPSMHFVGDSQTGFFSPSAGRITLVSVGSSILNVNPSGINVTGNVGIGTTNPTSKLTVTGDGTFSGVVTATTFSGSLTGNVTGNINSSGVSTLTTLNGTSGLVSVGTTFKTKGFVETQSTVSIGGSILTLDASQGTVFTHTTSAQIGIVSFTGIRTDTAGSQTFTVLVTQGATPVNTTGAAGIGTQLASIRITPGNVGYSTHIKVGGGTSITLTNSAGALDLLTFIVSYDGATSIANTSFKVVGFAATDFRNAVV